MNKRKVILRCGFPPGAVLMLTAAVRDLHLACPDQFITDVRTTAPELWFRNPWITPLHAGDPDAETIECVYPLIRRCNSLPYHFTHAFIDHLSNRLRVPFEPTRHGGDVHLAPEESARTSKVQEFTRLDVPFWILAPGWNSTFTVKHWPWERYQEVVDRFRGQIMFVQVGTSRPRQPRLSGVLDLTGRTNLRQLVRLMHDSHGVLCSVNLVMHLSAAVKTNAGDYRRPCVVIAGGREAPQWEAYPQHQYLHTVGALVCCASGGCWRARTAPLGDGSPCDRPGRLCVDVVDRVPRCMHILRASDVVKAIERYFEGGATNYLTREQSAACERGIRDLARVGEQHL